MASRKMSQEEVAALDAGGFFTATDQRILRTLERIEALLREHSTRHVTRKEKARRMGVHPATLRRRERRAELKRMSNFSSP